MYGVGASIYGAHAHRREFVASGRRAVYAMAGATAFAFVLLELAFVRSDFAEAQDTPLELIADHVRYVADRIGVEHVGLGSDFDGTTVPRAMLTRKPLVPRASSTCAFTRCRVDGPPVVLTTR